MRTLSMEHEIACSEDAFWEAFLDDTYNERLFKEVLGFPKFEVLEREDLDEAIVRRTSAQPQLGELQSMVFDVFRRDFEFIETGRFDKRERVWTWTLAPNLMPGKLANVGRVHVEALGAGGVRRHTRIDLTADVPMLGPFMERAAEKRQREGWDKSAAFMNEVWFSNA